MALARVQTLFIKSRVAQFFAEQTTVNQIIVLIGGSTSIPFFFNRQIFQLFSVLRDLINGDEINTVSLLTLLSEVGVILYSIFLYTHWSYKIEKKEEIKVKQNFSIPPDFLIIEEYKPIIPDGKSLGEQSDISQLVKTIDVKAIIEANEDPQSFLDKLRPLKDVVKEQAANYKEAEETAGTTDDNLMSGTLFEIMQRAEKQMQTA